MTSRLLQRVGLAAAAAIFVGMLTATGALGKSAGPPTTPTASINADFESYVNFDKTTACAQQGGVLVEGRGTATGPFGSFGSAIGTAQECSVGQFDPFDFPAPALDDCHNIPPFTPYFDVHGSGVYVTEDGSVLYLSYHELSENPFTLFPLPFFLHDCGVWSVDQTRQSTGIFAGAQGGGTISALVPVRTDFSAHVNATYSGTLTLASGTESPGQTNAHCTGYMTGPITGNLTVDKGQSCILDSATVNGNVDVNGGSLTMQYSIAGGNVDVHNFGAPTTFYASTALGNLDIHNGSGGVTIFNGVTGDNADVHNNNGPLTILVSPSIGGNLDVHDNTGFSLVSGNIVGNNVDCHGNKPAPLLFFSPDFSAFEPQSPVFNGNQAPNLRGQCSLFGLGPQEPTDP